MAILKNYESTSIKLKISLGEHLCIDGPRPSGVVDRLFKALFAFGVEKGALQEVLNDFPVF